MSKQKYPGNFLGYHKLHESSSSKVKYTTKVGIQFYVSSVPIMFSNFNLVKESQNC